MIALGVIHSAKQAKAPLISHICDKPREVDTHPSYTAEKAALMAIGYSLIRQLLEFNVESDKLVFTCEMMQKLDADDGQWESLLGLLADLLQNAPILRHCTIHGLNDLEWGSGKQWCEQLLDVLFRHFKESQS